MTQHLTRFMTAFLLAGTFALPAQAGPFNGPTEVAIPSAPDTNFVQLKQVSGFTGQLPLGYSDGAYAPVGNSFNKLAKFRLSLNCPAGYRAHQALDAANNNSPVYVSLDEELDSRIEFYGWCVSSDPLDQSAMYYDSSEDDGHAYPKRACAIS